MSGWQTRIAREMAAAHARRAAELERTTDDWDRPEPAPTPERAAELAAQGWTPRTNQDAPSVQAGRVTTTTR